MAISIETLKTWFETGDKPTQAQFEELIMSMHHVDAGKLIASTETTENSVTITLSGGVQLVIPIYVKPTDEPISYIQGLQSALNAKVDKITGKGLSTEDFTTALKNKLDTLVNYVHPNTHEMSEIAGLISALSAKANTADLSPIATSGNYNDLANKPRFKRIIDGFEVDTHGNNDVNVIEVGNICEGEYEPNRFVKFKVNSLPYTNENNISIISDNSIL